MKHCFISIAAVTLLAFFVTAGFFEINASQTDIQGPAGSGHFGTNVVALPNGNFLVTDPGYDAPGAVDAGAVYLYDGYSLALISKLTGDATADRVGNGGITVLSNGNFVVTSTNWSNGGVAHAGAVTWGSATTGVTGVVSTANSLVGDSIADLVGFGGVIALENGNYLVRSPFWENGAAVDAGAVTWGNGLTGVKGVVSAANSLVGSATADRVGLSGVVILTNNNYVVTSTNWNNGAQFFAGAATWGSGTAGVAGVVSAANSLIGGKASDFVGSRVVALSNGNYVVTSPLWDNGSTLNVGAATWGDGNSGVKGLVSAANSLIGVTANDNVGSVIRALKNGNYVVGAPGFDRAGALNSGSATWANGASGTTGTVTTANSLVGGTADDNIGGNIVALENGNYVVYSSSWDGPGAINAGAATWGNGSGGTTGIVAAVNSIVGGTGGDQVATNVVALRNGHYVIISPGWDNGALNAAGAVTWGNGLTGVKGVVSTLNSLVGGAAGDSVGLTGIAALNNGNYVVGSPNWKNGSAFNAGAATWCDGSTGRTGLVAVANSLVGNTSGYQVGFNVIALTNENYVVGSPFWNSSRGAVTWGSGTTGVTGIVSAVNSLVGAVAGDDIGSTIYPLKNGGYVAVSTNFDNSGIVNAGMASWGSGANAVSGVVSAANSLVGAVANDTIGSGGVTALNNGSFVASSPFADKGPTVNPGAVTWGSHMTGVTGLVSSANSLFGVQINDQIGNAGIAGQDDSQFIVVSRLWNKGGITNAGSATLGNGTTGIAGIVDPANSVLGSVAFGGGSMVFSYAQATGKLIVGYPSDNRVSVLSPMLPGTSPSITTDPQNSTNFISSVATFTVLAAGTATLDYQWRFNTTPLNNGLKISGATTTQLTVSNVSGLDGGLYDVVVTNNFGSITSHVAALTIVTQTVQFAGTTFETNACTMTFTGTAGADWWVLRATNILGPWAPVGQVAIAGNGTGLFTDPNPPPGMGFYQARSTP